MEAKSPVENNNSKSKSASARDGSTGFSLPRPLLVVFVALLIDLLAFTMILPLLPALLDYYGHQEDSFYRCLRTGINSLRDLMGVPDEPRWNSVLFGGAIGSMFSFLQFLASPIVGATSDVYGRRPLLIVTMIGVAFSYLLWAMSSNFMVFVIARIVGGISKGNVSVSTAVVSDVLPTEKRGRGMALIGIAYSLGFLIGPLIGAGFASSLRSSTESGVFFVAPALVALSFAVTDILFISLFFTETLPKEKRAQSLGSGLEKAKHYINPLALFKFKAVTGVNKADLKNLQEIGFIYFLYLFLYSGLEFTLTFLVHLRFNYNSMQQGRMFFFIGLIMIVVQGAFVRRLQSGSEQLLAARGILILMPALITVGVAYYIPVLYLGLMMFSFASATVVPCLTTMVASYGSAEQRGTVMGIFRSLGALARAFGPVVASTVYWGAGPAVCYTCGAVGLIVPYVLLRRVKITHTD